MSIYANPSGPRRSPAGTVALVVLPFLVSGMVAVGAYFYPAVKVAIQQTGQHAADMAITEIDSAEPEL